MGNSISTRIARASSGRILRGCVLSAAILFVALAAEFSNAQAPHRQTSGSPEDRVNIFYRWVIGTMVKKRPPVGQKKVVSAYLSKSLYRWLYSSADTETRNNYFIPGNDWSGSWIDEIKVVYKRKTGNRTMLRVDLGQDKPPGDFVAPVRVNLINEGGIWKIDCIQSADEELDIPKFDPKLDPSGCKPV